MPSPSAIRIDAEHRRKLAELSVARGSTVRKVLHTLIDQAYEEVDVTRRLALVAEIGRLAIEDAADSDAVSAGRTADHG